jgi:hypothetical protein
MPAVVHDHARARLREARGDPASHALGGPGNERDLAVEVEQGGDARCVQTA